MQFMNEGTVGMTCPCWTSIWDIQHWQFVKLPSCISCLSQARWGMRLLVIFTLIFTLAPVDRVQSAQMPEAQRIAEREAFWSEFRSLQSRVESLDRDFVDQRRILNDLDSKLDQIGSKSLKRDDIDTSKFATKAEISALKADIEKINIQWNKQHQDLKKEIQNQYTELRKILEGLNSGSLNSGFTASPQPHLETKKPVPSATKLKYPDMAIWEIRRGDTFSVIARTINEQHGLKLTPSDIEKANPEVNPRKLKIGQEIYFPIPSGLNLE